MFILKRVKETKLMNLWRKEGDLLQVCPFDSNDSGCGSWCPLFQWWFQLDEHGKSTGQAKLQLACSSSPRTRTMIIEMEET